MIQLSSLFSTILAALFSFASTFIFCACTTTAPLKHEAAHAPDHIQQELKSAEASLHAGDKRAIARLRKIAEKNPGTDVAGEARLSMGEHAYIAQKYSEAIAQLTQVTDSPLHSTSETRARLLLAHALIKFNKAADAQKQFTILAQAKDLSPEQQTDLAKMRFEAFNAEQKYREALTALSDLADSMINPTDKDRLRVQEQEYLDAHLSVPELESVASDTAHPFLQASAKYRLGLLSAEEKQFAKARRYFSEASALVPNSDMAERANRYVDQIDARNRVESGTIGVVLPLSGKQGRIGQKALRAIQLGLGIYGKDATHFRLAIIDSEGHPDGGRRGIDKLVQEDNVIGIIGGLLSKTAEAEAARAQEFGVPMIVLTQKSGVTLIGDEVFRNALTSQMQVHELVDIAMGKLGYKSFAVMFPNDAYGVEYTNLFWDEVRSRGGSITGAQPYESKETDFRGHVQRLTGLFYVEDRADEYRYKLKDWEEKNPKRSARQGGPAVDDILDPVVDFDALFIPDSARAIGQIAPMLAYNNIKNVKLLGTNLWNSPSLVSRGQKSVEGSLFVDSVVTNDPSFQNSAFFSDFKTTFSEEPGLTELQAYDSALIFKQLIAGGETTRIGLQRKMSSLQNFPGAVGPLSMSPEREILRPLTALVVHDGKINRMEAAQRE